MIKIKAPEIRNGQGQVTTPEQTEHIAIRPEKCGKWMMTWVTRGMPGIPKYKWCNSIISKYTELIKFAPKEFTEKLEELADTWIKKDIAIIRKTSKPSKYQKELMYTDCRAGFNHSTEVYWSHLLQTHGITFNLVNMKEDEICVPQVTALEPNEKLDQKLTINILKAYGQYPYIRSFI